MVINNQINSEFVTAKFGSASDIFKKLIDFLTKKAVSSEKYKKSFKKWRTAFINIYGKTISSELFLKHTYYNLILKIITIAKINPPELKQIEVSLHEIEQRYFKKFNLFDYEFLNWISIDLKIFNKILNEIKNSNYAKQDVFSELYQQIFSSDFRRTKGEFYTPKHLVTRMIDDFYSFGSKILDPSSGSGNFLMNIIAKILKSEKSQSLKLNAISNVYGFDVNPVAVTTAKVNIFLLLTEYFPLFEMEPLYINIYQFDSIFPEAFQAKSGPNLNILLESFDQVIGNPPWLTYKDLNDKDYQVRIRELSGKLEIKPLSQYITHIELAAVFFYAIPATFLKKGGNIFFILPKSVLNGDHCFKFRAFSIFDKYLEIWDFPSYYFFNVPHICLKAVYLGKKNNILIRERFPIKVKLFNDTSSLLEETYYTSLQINKNGAKIISSEKVLKNFGSLEESSYKTKFYQGATLVPRTLVFFRIQKSKNGILTINSDLDILSRAKKKWEFSFQNKEIRKNFCFKTFLNLDVLPFYIKTYRTIFLPINENFEYDHEYFREFPKTMNFYEELNNFYIENKKETSKIETLFDNLNYWNKLQKQINNKSFIIVYNASGSNLKAAVINNENTKIIIGSENYYYSTDSEEEAYYLSAILNAPNLSKKIKLIKSSRHIHKRPFMFPIPLYDETNQTHIILAKKGKKYQIIVEELFVNNPNITPKKVRMIINRNLMKLQNLTEELVFH
ncbi:hypothetical protein LCGC14_0913650 [marine sediment metagenome]|uniref:site-specific DNA-methyltransferase (adenine-specific) n=1 Tax=marine sediment metagenome TaxID=412755 RepID=A0A0F9NST3_9ZZZZ